MTNPPCIPGRKPAAVVTGETGDDCAAEALPAATPATDRRPRQPQRDRPTAARALFAPCIAPTWMAGLVLFLCLWLPQFTGCDGIDVRPVDRFSRADDFQHQLATATLLWPHWFGALTAIALIAVAAVRPPDPGRWLVVGPLTLWSGLLFCGGILVVLQPPSDRQAWLEILLLLPAGLAPGVWGSFALYRRQWLSAWARLTSALALLSYPMLVLSTMPSRNSLYGLTVALIAATCLAPLAWIVRWRGRRVLVDRGAATEPIRFRLVHLMLLTTLIAATLGYYRLVPWMFDEAQR